LPRVEWLTEKIINRGFWIDEIPKMEELFSSSRLPIIDP